MEKIQLTKSKSSQERYYLINEGMGGYGEKANHANNHYSVVNGIDRGNGYQGHMAISYFLTLNYIPATAKNLVKKILKEKNLEF